MREEGCDIIIPVWNEQESTSICIDKVREHTHGPYRLIIIDNASGEATRRYLEGLRKDAPGTVLIRNEENLGFVKAVNQGIRSSAGRYICILNNDTVVTEDWLERLIDTCEKGPGAIGIANPASNVFGDKAPYGGRYGWQELDSARGFCMLIKREVVERVGLFDEAYGMGYFEEKDFSRRAIEAGYICVKAGTSFVYHRDRLSFDKIKERDEIFRENEKLYNRKWGRPLSIAFIARSGSWLAGRRDAIYALLNKGHRVNIFLPDGMARPRFKDHIQIRYFSAGRVLFSGSVLYRLWERRRKKKIDVVIPEDDGMKRFLSGTKGMHGSDLFSGGDDALIAFCNAKSKEW
ncbi:MAG: glycosyltransferase family 2 protein [Candidatus Omnitrophota bacterium]